MAKVIIFGVQDYAELAHYYLEQDSPHDVVAFCVNEKYLPTSKQFKGLPVVAYEQVVDLLPPAEFSFFAPMSPRKMNTDREVVFNDIRAKGYRMISYVSSKATVLSSDIGENCFILEDNTIQPFTRIGQNVVIWSGSHIGHHGCIHDHVTVTSHVVVSGHCTVEAKSFLGVNATLRDGITIGTGSFIAMSAAVTKNTEAWSVYKGNPAARLSLSSLDLKF